MKYKSHQIKGKGRGRFLGFPTINLSIPENFDIPEGIYAARVWIGNHTFQGAMHFGPIPTFNEKEITLEIFLIDAGDDFNFAENKQLEFEPTEKIREIKNFPGREELINQISSDVTRIKSVFSKEVIS